MIYTFRFERVALGMALATLLLLPVRSSLAQEDAQADILKRLERLEHKQAETDQQVKAKDERIGELESEVERLRQESAQEAPPKLKLQPNFGGYKVADTDVGDLSISFYSSARYLNQKGLKDTYTDSSGRTHDLDLREDFQLTKAMIFFKGWLLNPKFRYTTYLWSANTSQGQGAQVVVAGNMYYRFDETFNLGAGIFALPATRSLEGSWPRFLKVDSRTIADEYFRGSYSTGIWGDGKLGDLFNYRVMLANNLSQLGVDATQLDNNPDTVSMALWCMPTTGEYGPGGGFGDFEDHKDLATRVGVHYTHSTEDRQSQPGKDDPENTQIRISDGTAIFDIGAFAPDTQVEQARYQMASLDSGMKFHGFSLEGEYFARWVDHLESASKLPVTDLFDHGFQLQASYMLIPKTLQIYPAGSKIFGEYGEPWDLALGLNWYPIKKEGFERDFRINTEATYLSESPTGNNTVPYIVGGDGMVYSVTAELMF